MCGLLRLVHYVGEAGLTRETEMTDTNELVAAVKAHARKHYNAGGWDVIVECWGDAQIAECVGRATTTRGAIRAVGQIAGIYAERQADAKNSAF